MSFAVVVPLYNEELGVAACVRAVCSELGRLPNRSTLIAVNDGSKDNTPVLLAQLSTEQPLLTVVNHPRNQGYGAALRTGIATAAREGYQYVLFMDSDLTNLPEDIPRFAAEMEKGADVIKGTRYSNGGSTSDVPWKRVFISRWGNRLARLLFRVSLHDCTNGFRACRVNQLTKMKLQENRFPIIMEELYWAKFLNCTFAEVPVVLSNRKGDQRPTSFTYQPQVFADYLKYPIRACFGVPPVEFNSSL